MFHIVLAAVLFCVGVGCARTVTVMDLRDMSPFSDYVEKDVPLAVPCVLYVAHTGAFHPDTGGFYQIITKTVWEQVRPVPTDVSFVELPAGSSVFIVDTRLTNLGGYMDIEYLRSRVIVSPNDPRWPSRVLALFRHEPPNASNPETGILWYRLFKGDIVAAPWEPIGTPELRHVSIAKPDQMHYPRKWHE